ncbi:unnamed protein product, partial [Rotaria sp. Silwood1]
PIYQRYVYVGVLGNPFDIIRIFAEGVESFFYKSYKSVIEGLLEFVEGVATSVLGKGSAT